MINIINIEYVSSISLELLGEVKAFQQYILFVIAYLRKNS